MNPFGILAVAAILCGWRLTHYYSLRLGLDPAVGSRFARLLVLGGALGALAGGFSTRGALLGSALAGLLFLKAAHRPLRYFDAAALAFPPSWLLFRAGCSVVHDHPGALAAGFLAVQFSDGPRWDLGLLEFLATVPLAVAFLYLGRQRRPDGFYFGALAISYGSIRLVLFGFAGASTHVVWYSTLAVALGLAIVSRPIRNRGWSVARRSAGL